MKISKIDTSHYAWRIPTPCEDTPGDTRLLVPRADPHLYEYPFDFIFGSPEDAVQGLKDFDAFEDARDDEWVLVKVTCDIQTVDLGEE